MEFWKSVYTPGMGEVIIKKSRFIGTAFPVESEDQALSLIEKTKKNCYDANHNCYSYVIGMNNELMRYSDDGEPSGTAGKPMLDILIKEEIRNTLIIATRYFGGTLLGTGGLVRAYQACAKEALAESVIAEKFLASKVTINTDYTLIGKLQYICAECNAITLEIDYTHIVSALILVPYSAYKEFVNKWTTANNGCINIFKISDLYYAYVEGKLVVF